MLEDKIVKSILIDSVYAVTNQYQLCVYLILGYLFLH